MQVDDQMHAGAAHTVARGEMIVALLDRSRGDDAYRDFLSGGS